jgi:hypothetical protein
MTKKHDVLKLLEECSPEERREVFTHLRKEFPIHAFEKQLNTSAEVILEALSRSPDLTQRGIRGIIAEQTFITEVLQKLQWTIREIVGDVSYDFLLEDAEGEVTIQVKTQRKEKGAPKVRRGKYVVEVQRTRGGIDAVSGEPTRPYRFGEFDILAVSMHASTGEWSAYMYTVGSWLRPSKKDSRMIETLQPVSPEPDDDWTNSLELCIGWFRLGLRKTIAGF